MTATPPATPPLLKTYQDARLLWEAKGWKLVGAADDLAGKPELERFSVSPATLSKKTKAESPSPIEPEMAAAVEALKTWPGHERQVEIVIRGLRALHGAVPGEEGGAQGEDGAASGEDVAKVLKELRDALPGELVEALEAKAGARESKLLEAVARLGRTTWRRVAISSGLGALVGCLILVPLIIYAARPSHVFIIYPPAGRPDASPRWLEPGSALAMFEWGEKMPKPPVDQTVPDWTLPGQKVAPCDARVGMKEINGNCWVFIADVKPPCGALFRHGDKCYAPVSAKPWPAEPGEDR